MASAWLEIFKAGTHTSGNGIVKTYTNEDLEQIAQTYNAQTEHEAPLVLGHPTTDDPAYGWAKELKTTGEKLLAFVDQISDGIVDSVKRGEYKKISIALYPDNLLRHIGLLGATPPAVKGLGPVTFSSELEFEEYVWATDEYRMPTVARILSGLRDFFIDKFGLDVADKVIDKSDVAYLQESAPTKMITLDDTGRIVPQENIDVNPPGAISNFSENKIEEEENMDELKAEIQTLKDTIATQATQFSEMQTAITTLTELVSTQAKENEGKAKLSAFETAKADFAVFCESLVAAGKVLPAEKDGVIEEYADVLQAEETLTFAEGTIKPSAKMKARLESRAVMFTARPATFANAEKAQKVALDATKVPVEFADVANKVDPQSIEIDREIREYAETNKVTYEEAAEKYGSA